MDKNTQQPVGWVWQFPDGEFYETPHHTKEECERDCCGYDGVAVPCFTAPPVPRDVLMAALGDCRAECAKHYLGDADDSQINLAAIADRYASKVQPERCQCCGYLVTESEHKGCLRAGRAAIQPEPVNQQLLAALKELDQFTGTPEQWAYHAPIIARAAIATAEAAQKPENNK